MIKKFILPIFIFFLQTNQKLFNIKQDQIQSNIIPLHHQPNFIKFLFQILNW